MTNSNKKQNIFAAYFKPFGLKQICDILMPLGAILAVIGAFTVRELLLAGLIIFMLADAIVITRDILILTSKISRRSPEYRNAIASACVSAILFILALVGLIYYFVV